MKSRPVLAAIAALAFLSGSLALTGSASAARAPWCTNADLSASYRTSGAAMGSVYGYVVLRNRSTHACRTGGWAGVSYVGDGDGTRIGAPADRIGTPTTFVLTPGRRARSLLQQSEEANYPRATCRPHAVDGFRIYVPDATRSQFVAHRGTGCLNVRVHLLTEKPLRLA